MLLNSLIYLVRRSSLCEPVYRKLILNELLCNEKIFVKLKKFYVGAENFGVEVFIANNHILFSKSIDYYESIGSLYTKNFQEPSKSLDFC